MNVTDHDLRFLTASLMLFGFGAVFYLYAEWSIRHRRRRPAR